MILHLAVARECGLKEFLAQHADPSRIEFLLHHGCVYVDGVRRREDLVLRETQIVRLHLQPKSYSWERSPLKNRIVFDHNEFFALDKPPGLPVHATLDNFVDNAKYILEQELGKTVYSTHRLDIPTQGLLLFAKTPSAQTLLNKMFAKRRVEKIYFAITETEVGLGEHVLWINPETRVPRETSFTPRENWWECRLEVLDVQKIEEGFCHKIRLITGKTHQIRAQLSALGAPILGDTTYGSTQSYVPERLALECHSLSFTYRSETLTLTRPNSISRTPPVLQTPDLTQELNQL